MAEERPVGDGAHNAPYDVCDEAEAPLNVEDDLEVVFKKRREMKRFALGNHVSWLGFREEGR